MASTDSPRVRRFSRRSLLRAAAGASVAAALPLPVVSRADAPRRGTLTVGLIADVHHDVMHDGIDRITTFVDAMTARGADMIFQLGDFCVPDPRNDAFMAAWRRFAGPRYHVIGNHDTDEGHSRDETVAFYGMPANHYSFDSHGLHFVVLDGNDPMPDPPYAGARHVGEAQRAWFADDLAKTKLPTLVFIHQPIDHGKYGATAAARRIIRETNAAAGFDKVVAVFEGHFHLDYMRRIDNVGYFQINSASYVWVGGAHAHQSYDDAIHAQAPALQYTCPYREPLWALLTLDLDRGVLSLEGRQSAWVGPSPQDLGVGPGGWWEVPADVMRPQISNQRFDIQHT